MEDIILNTYIIYVQNNNENKNNNSKKSGK